MHAPQAQFEAKVLIQYKELVTTLVSTIMQHKKHVALPNFQSKTEFRSSNFCNSVWQYTFRTFCNYIRKSSGDNVDDDDDSS